MYFDFKVYNASIKDLMVILIQDPQIINARILLGKALKVVIFVYCFCVYMECVYVINATIATA